MYLAEVITDLRNNNIHLLHFFAYMDLPEANTKQEEQSVDHAEVPAKRQSGLIEFQQVWFQYPQSQEWVLQDIDLTVQAGEKLSVVGENGSGKTTLIKLLCRLYRPTKGRILLNGRDIWSYDYEEYIGYLSTVFQDFSLFAFFLAENVAASRTYQQEQVEMALEKAGLKQKVAGLEEGIQQTLFHDFQEDGTDLSGGEAQKVAIARAIYKDVPIMILDEPTASLDPYAEYDIYKNFQNMSTEKTLFSISHRLSSCKLCDRILVLSNGKLIQCGKHEELLGQTTGKYRKMWDAQAKYYTK